MSEENKVVDEPVSKEKPVVSYSVNITKPMFGGDKEKLSKLNYRALVAWPMNSTESFKKHVDNIPNTDFDLSPNVEEFRRAAMGSTDLLFKDEQYNDIFRRPGSKWTQYVDYHGTQLGLRKIGHKPKDGDDPLTGERGVSAIAGAFDMGSYIDMPFWHSGIWLKLKPPGDVALLSLHDALANEKIIKGRFTNGFSFGNTDAVFKRIFLEFLIAHVYDTNIKDWNSKDSFEFLGKLILSTDYLAAMGQLAAIVYPNGFPVSIPHTSDIEKCIHVERMVADITRMHLTDFTKLTPDQIKFMGERSVKRTVEEIKAYQEMGIVNQPHTFTINPDADDPSKEVKITLKIPTVLQTIQTGENWMTSIYETINKVIASDATEDEIRNKVVSYINIAIMREYTHYVKSITRGDIANLTTPAEIEKVLELLSGKPEEKELFIKKVREYINDSTLSLFGVLSFDCPVCKQPMSPDSEVIPIKTDMVFFTLTGQRITRVKRI